MGRGRPPLPCRRLSPPASASSPAPDANPVTTESLIRFYRSAVRSGDRRLADALTRALREDPALADAADRALRELPRGAPRPSRAGRRVLRRLLARLGGDGT